MDCDHSALQPSIRVMMMPKDTNPIGTVFGGIILSYIDQAGAIEAHAHGGKRLVTVAMDKVEFHEPVHVGDLVSFYTHLVSIGNTSIAVKVCVYAERPYAKGGKRGPARVTEAQVVYVNVDASRRPVPLPPRG